MGHVNRVDPASYNTAYRIVVTTRYDGDHEYWQWRVYTDGELNAVAKSHKEHRWRWTARRAAEKAARTHAFQGYYEPPNPDKTLDYVIYPGRA